MRRSGKTTRLVDKAIQDFFTKGRCVFTDEAPNQRHCLNTIKRRLLTEHNIRESDVRILTHEDSVISIIRK